MTHPTPWYIEGQAIRDANGCVIVSAINPCDMATRRRIVDAVNELELLLAAGAINNPETESPKGMHARKGEYVDRVGDLENRDKPHVAPRGGNRNGSLGHRSAIDLGPGGAKRQGGASRDDCGLATNGADFLGANEYKCR